jgi:hypothetical protein
MTTTITYPHGLGDCVYFAHQLPLYKRRGHDIRIVCNPDKRCLFPPECVVRTKEEAPKVAWNHARHLEEIDSGNHWMANKAMFNFSASPMPDIGPPCEELWREFASEKVDIQEHIPQEASRLVKGYFEGLERPVILLHTKGNSFQKAKSVPDDLALEIYRSILDETGGTLILLDWDNRVPRIAHSRIKHLTDDWKKLSVEELLAAIQQADLAVGIDSGPLHLCRFFNTPAVSLWFNGHHPAKYSLPRAQQVNICLRKDAPKGNKHTRWFYNIIEEHGDQIRASIVGRTCRKMLESPRYLSRAMTGRDVMMQHWVQDWMAGGIGAGKTFVDRDRSFDLMLRHLACFDAPQVVETGCIRAEEDWRGAGFSTYLLGACVTALGGGLHSADHSSERCAFARKWTQVFGGCVDVEQSDSVDFLNRHQAGIDLLYLDSMDTHEARCASHRLVELETAMPKLHQKTMVVMEDTSILAGKWRGKGSLGVPWMLSQGWTVVHSGHQTVLVRA